MRISRIKNKKLYDIVEQVFKLNTSTKPRTLALLIYGRNRKLSCTEEHIYQTKIPLSRASGHGLSILLDNANGSGSTAQGMFGYFHFHFVDVRGTLAVGWNYASRERGPRATALLDLSHIKIIVAILIMHFVLLPAVAAGPPSHTFCSLLMGTLALTCQEKLPEIGRQIFADSPPLRESSCSLPSVQRWINPSRRNCQNGLF